MKTLLMIGNSFADDAAAFLHQTSQAFDEEILVGVLYFGGCSLQRHASNLKNGIKEYEYRENGVTLFKSFSIQEAVERRDWDFVSFQQASRFSGKRETFQPYLNELLSYVRGKLPKARMILYKTWAYEEGYQDPQFAEYGYDPKAMDEAIGDTFKGLGKETGIKILIDGGGLIAKAKKRSGRSLHRDGLHMNEEGRCLLADLFCFALAGKPHGVYLPSDPSYEGEHEMPLARDLIENEAFVGRYWKTK